MKRKVLYALISVLIAFGIWVYVVTVVSPESEGTFYNIPVVLTNESVMQGKGLMVVSDETPTVTLQLKGNRADLIGLKNSDITVTADLSKINGSGEQKLSYNVDFTGNPNAFEVVSQTPGQITLLIAEWATKDVPVQVTFTGSLDLDYIAYEDELTLSSENVTLTGPKEVVDQITQAKVEVSLDGRVESVDESYRYTLCDENGDPVDAASITTNLAEVTVGLKIQRVKQIQLLLDIAYGGGATAENTLIVLDQQTIKVSGSDKVLDGFDSLVIGSIDLQEVLEDTVLTFPVELPEGVENLSGVTEVSAEVTFDGLVVKTIGVTRIIVTGLPAGMSYDIGTKKVEVTLRGPEAMMEALTADYISLLVDISGGQLGDSLYKTRIMVDEGNFAQVGVIGNYMVLVTLTEAAEETQNGTEG